jgi:hypothetical protein
MPERALSAGHKASCHGQSSPLGNELEAAGPLDDPFILLLGHKTFWSEDLFNTLSVQPTLTSLPISLDR